MSETINLNDRILSRRPVAPDDDPDAFDDWGTFGLLRGAKDRAIMLDVRLKSGNREAFAYSLLERVSFDPSEGLTLRFFGVEVKLVGRNMTAPIGSGLSLLDALHRHRAAWVRESPDGPLWTPAEAGPVITQISVAAAK